MMENEDADPVGPRDPEKIFRGIAAAAGVIREGDPLDRNLIDFAYAVVELCASIGDGYKDEDGDGDAGAHIRAELGDE